MCIRDSNSTFPSTRQMNEVLAREKAQMPPDKLKRLDELEAAGLFGKGEAWEHGRYTAEYEALAWGPGYFPFLYGARPDSTYDPAQGNAPGNWELYREMWGSHGEFIIDGNLKSVEWVDRLHTIHCLLYTSVNGCASRSKPLPHFVIVQSPMRLGDMTRHVHGRPA